MFQKKKEKNKKKSCIFWSAMIAKTENILVTGTVAGNCHLVTDQSRAEQSRAIQYELKIED